MIERITTAKLMDLYLDTLNRCGTHLLNKDDAILGHEIFEEFDVGAISFLHKDNLERLVDEGFISIDVMRKSSELRKKFLEIQNSDLWNLERVRKSEVWLELFKLSDEIKKMIEDEK